MRINRTLGFNSILVKGKKFNKNMNKVDSGDRVDELQGACASNIVEEVQHKCQLNLVGVEN